MKKIKSVVVGLTVVLLATNAAYAQQQSTDKQGGNGKKGEIFKELNLTAEQDKKLQENRLTERQEMMGLRNSMKEKQEQLQKVLEDSNTTKATVEPLAAEIKALQGQLVDHRINAIFAVKEILTPEQFAKFQQIMEKKKEGKKGHSQRWEKRN
jgi:Spy/CpxP family protein refolding chaperone